MDSYRNRSQYWQAGLAGLAGSLLTDTGGEEEDLQSPTTPQYCVPNSDNGQTLGGELWEELEQLSPLPVDPDASLLHNDLEDHQRNASSSEPFESIENAIPSTNWESRSQFQVDYNGNSHGTSSEFWKSFLEVGDGDDVETAPGPENLGMCSRATQGPLPKRNHTTASKIAQNLKPRRNQENIDGVKKTGKRHRCPNWTLEENRSFLQLMEVQKGKSPWKAISDGLKTMGFARKAKACEDHWGVLLADLKKFEKHFGSDNILRDLHLWPSVGTMSREQRSQNGLPLVFEVEWFEAMARIVNERSKHRKSRRECSKLRIHVAGTPFSSSRRLQSRLSGGSATPSFEIFDTPVGNGDGISGLVKLLGSTDRNVTVDQTIEVMRISLEAQKMDLRRQEIEWERERMYRGQRNGLTEKARRTPPAHEWN